MEIVSTAKRMVSERLVPIALKHYRMEMIYVA